MQSEQNPLKIESISFKFSQTVSKVFQALIKAQGEIPTIKKNGVNTFFKNDNYPNGSPYSTLDDILEDTKKIMHDNGLGLFHNFFYLDGRFKVESFLIHTSGEWINMVSDIFVNKQDMQGLGGSNTYARRYIISNLFKIASEFDADGNLPGANQNQGNSNKNKNNFNQNKSQNNNQQKNNSQLTANQNMVFPNGFGNLSGKKIIGTPESTLHEVVAFCEVELTKNHNEQYLKTLSGLKNYINNYLKTL